MQSLAMDTVFMRDVPAELVIINTFTFLIHFYQI
jgi:hypothetical protein